MPVASHHQRQDHDDRKVVFLELASASVILFIVAVVLAMIFLYKPVQ
ncbi:MAG: hypothetical protein HY235_23530 [Acidobacteria bacterium]|nr:hypothetical protein [Acidobacteriota bacterium]